VAYRALGLPYNTPLPFDLQPTACLENFTQKSSAPTWMIGIDFKPIDELLIYAKWSRGYRQGGTSPLGGEGYQTYEPEKVDTYEAGIKANWRGAVPGSFNLAGFYNDFRDQQIQLGLQSTQTNPPLNPTISIFNAGRSRIYGLEAELNISPVDGLQLSAAYSYTSSKITEYSQPTATVPYDIINPVQVGLRLPFTIPHKFTASAFYTLPLPASLGKVTIGGTYVRQSETFTIASTNGALPGWDLANASITWEGVAGTPVDISAFVTNIWNEKYFTHVNDQANCGLNNNCAASTNRGFTSYNLGEPRMFGVRVKYHFGQ
jgi:iron complex outermembrane recepter protein